MKAKYTSPYLIFGLLTGGVILGMMTLLIHQDQSPLLSYLVTINLTLFGLYGYDKHASRTEQLRVPEKVLHLLALLGGSPAGLMAQHFFHHKTLKGSFQLIYWATVTAQVGFLYWLIRSNLLISSIKSVGNIA